MPDPLSNDACKLTSRKCPLKRLLKRLRMWFLQTFRYRFVSVGRDFYIGYGTHIRSGCVSVGDHCYIGNHCHIASQVQMGNWVMVASNVSMVGGDHDFHQAGMPSVWAGRSENRPIVIEDDAWIGHGAIIMHGVRIGEGAIVGAGALVTHDVPPYAIVVNRPAEVVAQRFEGEQLELHRKALDELRQQLDRK